MERKTELIQRILYKKLEPKLLFIFIERQGIESSASDGQVEEQWVRVACHAKEIMS